MPKQKSHSGSKKRFWLTGTGKVKRPHGGKNHKAETKNRKRKRNLKQEDSEMMSKKSRRERRGKREEEGRGCRKERGEGD